MYPSRRGKGIRSIVALTLVFWTSPVVFCQTVDLKLTQKVAAFDSESSSTIEQLVELAQKFQIPIGIEWLHTTNEKRSRPIHVRDALVQDALRMILQQQRDYKYRLRDGIVHVFPSALIRDRHNFLNLLVPIFKVQDESLIGVNYHLTTSIQQLLHPSPGFGGGYGGVGLRDDFAVRNITFAGRNLTVRQILSKSVALQGNALWVVRLKNSEMMKNEPFYAQTVSLTSDDVAPDFFWKFIPLKKL